MAQNGPVGFDLDMTLIDSRPAIMASFAAVARETGVAIDLDQLAKRLGIKLEDELGHWFPHGEVENAAEIYRRHYIALAERTVPLPGARQALAAVRSAGERAVIITAKHPVSVEPSLRAAGLQADETFTHVHGPEKGTVLVNIGASAYVGDTPADMAAAKTAGATAVGVPTGAFTKSELHEAGADLVLNSLTEFRQWYERSRLPRRS